MAGSETELVAASGWDVCLSCGERPESGTPVVLVASHAGREYVVCDGCARRIEGAGPPDGL